MLLQIFLINGLNSSLLLSGNTEHLYGAITAGSDKYFEILKGNRIEKACLLELSSDINLTHRSLGITNNKVVLPNGVDDTANAERGLDY